MTMANPIVHRRQFLYSATGALAARPAAGAPRPPNIVLIVCDDLGYGDTSPYGGPIPTPNLARMAREGVRFTNYCTAGPVCSASRAGYMTGRYGQRMGVLDVFFPHAASGMDLSETTMADMVKAKSYRTMCVGKWHLGDAPRYLPTSRGFDEYFGIPYSVDMTPRVLMHNIQVLEQEAPLDTLTQRYTEQAVRFIEESKDSPFFLYLPHSMPHIPQGVSARFRGKSEQGLYGDVVQEIDWSVGEILSTLGRLGLDSRTLVMFSSDHGPWYQGSPGRLRGRKGSTYEGGMRVAFYARMPGSIPAGRVSNALMSSMDILPTVAGLCGAPLPQKKLDGVDAWPLLTGHAAEIERDGILYFMSQNFQCIRRGRWKLRVAQFNTPVYFPPPSGGRTNIALSHPELYDLETDADESYDVAPEHPEVVRDLQDRLAQLLTTFPDSIQRAWADAKARHDTETRTAAPPRLG